MKTKKLLSTVTLIFYAVVLSGCATTQQGRSFISESFQSEIKREVFIVPVIDARPAKEIIRDIKEIDDYNTFYKNTILYTVNKRGFIPKELTIDIKNCGS